MGPGSGARRPGAIEEGQGEIERGGSLGEGIERGGGGSDAAGGGGKDSLRTESRMRGNYMRPAQCKPQVRVFAAAGVQPARR